MKTKFLPRTNKLQFVFELIIVFFMVVQNGFAQFTHTSLPIPPGNVAPGTNNHVIYGMQINNLAPHW